MTAAGILQTLRRLGVVIAPEGDRLRFRARHDRVPPELRDAVTSCRTDVAALVSGGWWPSDRPKPNLYDLGNAHGASAVRAALAEVGCNLAERNPSWEEIFVVAEVLEDRP